MMLFGTLLLLFLLFFFCHTGIEGEMPIFFVFVFVFLHLEATPVPCGEEVILGESPFKHTSLLEKVPLMLASR